MGRNEYELQRTNSICPSPDVQLLDAVRQNDSEKIREIIYANSKKLLYNSYGEPFFKPILPMCCYDLCNEVTKDTVQTLIDLGADLDLPNENDSNKRVIHYAVLGGNPEILRVVVRNLNKEGINALSAGNTPLNLLIKEGGEFSDEADLPECAKILVQAGADVNYPDNKDITPILWAAKKGRSDIVEVLLKESLRIIDLDTHKFFGKTARDFITEKSLYSGYLPPESVLNNNQGKLIKDNPADILFGYLRSRRIEDFKNSCYLENYADGDDGEKTLLQFAVKEGLTDFVDVLLQKGADPNRVTEITKDAPIEIAATLGFHEIFQKLIDHHEIKLSGKVLVELLKYIDNKIVIKEINHRLCYDLCMEKINDSDVNTFDKNGNTPLHLAARYAGPEITLDLLRHGASMACKNNHGILPIEDITAKTLKTHLDECIEIDSKDRVYKENFTSTFNYSTLIPPKNKIHVRKLNESDPESGYDLLMDELEQLQSETEVLMYMSDSAELKDLLTHPVITSFLYLKWHRIRCFFYTNLIFYITFCLSLIFYIYTIYNNDNFKVNQVWCLLISIPLYVTFVLIVFRELFQIIISPKDYIKNVENWIEILLLVITVFILFQGNPTVADRKKLSSIAVLLAAFELVLLIGQHPKMSTNVVMLRTVSWNFFKFLLWYSILFIAFALSFYTLFQETPSETGGESEPDFFENPGTALFKTFVMMTGEFDASDIKFSTFPSISHLVFALFVFTMAIILFNLLNGLAVSDTQTIKSNAELVGHIARIKHINYIENMLLGTFLPRNFLKTLGSFCTCLPLNSIEYKCSVPKTIARRACLFPYFLEPYKMTVYPNQRCRVILPQNENEATNCVTECSRIYLDKDTAKRTKNLIRNKSEFEQESPIDLILALKKEQVVIREKLEELLLKMG